LLSLTTIGARLFLRALRIRKTSEICGAYHEFLVSEFPEYVTVFLWLHCSLADLYLRSMRNEQQKLTRFAQAINNLPLDTLKLR